MPSHREHRVLPYRPDQMFDLVADVGSYPQFLPWIIATRIKSRSEMELVADLVVGFKMIREQFTSRVLLQRPGHIHVDYVSGPLTRLHNDWRFAPTPDGGTSIDFCVDFEFRNRVFERLAGAVFSEAFRRMVGAFEKRALQLYGSGSASPPAPAASVSSSSANSAA